MKVLVVEDIEMNIEAAREALGESHELTIATNYHEAMSLLNKEQFEVVLTDLFFPETDCEAVGVEGNGLIDLLKAQKRPRPVTGGFIFSERAEPEFDDEYAPMGLKVFAQATRQSTSCLIVSNGNRHHGSLAFVRNAVGRMPGADDPLPETLYRQGCCDEYTKSDPSRGAWKQALEDALEAKFDASHDFAKSF